MLDLRAERSIGEAETPAVSRQAVLLPVAVILAVKGTVSVLAKPPAVKKYVGSLSFFGEPSGTRTRDPVIKSHMLYRPELTAHQIDEFLIITGCLADWKGWCESICRRHKHAAGGSAAVCEAMVNTCDYGSALIGQR
jgi:hypothetical protein